MSTVAKPITFEESLLLPEDKCEEIIDGVSRCMPPASRPDRRTWEMQACGSGQRIRREPKSGAIS